MQLENQAYQQEAPYSTSRSNLWPVLMMYLQLAFPLESMKEVLRCVIPVVC